MSTGDWKNKISKLDSFWDLDLLIERPAARKREDKPRTEPRVSEITLQDGEKSGTVIKKYIIPQRKAEEKREEAEREYALENSLIHSVKVYPWRTNYNYYEAFYNDVKRYYEIEADEVSEEKFFSYVPQYSQMSASQLKWYFYWRSMARRGEFLHADYSVIMLYIFEIINTEYNDNAEDGIKQLCLVWKNYSKVYPQLNKYLGEWICDFGLIHGVSAPKEVFGDDMPRLMYDSVLKEFYASSYLSDSNGFVDIILEFCSSYDYKKSRYYENNRELYERAVRRVLLALIDDGLIGGFEAEDCTMHRDSFVGALCSYHAKKKLEIKYCSFSRTNEFRYIVGDIIKYVENKIRAFLSIKSRLGVYSLKDDVRARIDTVFADIIERLPYKKKVKTVVNEYDKLYDVPKKQFSLSDANKIELDSWETTKRLVEAFEEDKDEPITVPEKAEKESDKITLRFLLAAKEKDYALQKEIAKESGRMADSLADEINDRAVELFGDILLENDGFGYSVIEDYEDELEGLMGGM